MLQRPGECKNFYHLNCRSIRRRLFLPSPQES